MKSDDVDDDVPEVNIHISPTETNPKKLKVNWGASSSNRGFDTREFEERLAADLTRGYYLDVLNKIGLENLLNERD